MPITEQLPYQSDKSSHGRCSKNCSQKFCNTCNTSKTPVLKSLLYKVADSKAARPATLWKTDSNTDVFLWIFQNFSDHIFWRTYAYSCFWGDIRKWLFRTFFLCSCFQNHHSILQKYLSLSNQNFKHNLVHVLSLNLTPALSFEPRFC